MTDHRETLRKIRTFPQLIKYLRDELDWPIHSEDFDDLVFEYTPEELGIYEASAAKIQEIKRLRPLTASQPWGIFFIKFEPKWLPVVALRRVLSSVVLKKRASANSSERMAWKADDLLFVSNYGEGSERCISFAHFSQDSEKTDLPTLKVLGWDNLDTPLHLDRIADVLRERLVWPEDEDDVAHWRESWRSAFTLRHREVITTSKTLAVRLAELARAIRDRIRAVLAIETESGPITKLMKAFQEALVHDLDADGFADMYAQTIAYGLLSARVTNPKANTADGFATQLPVTNPFLKELMETFLHVGGRKGKAGRGSGVDFDELGVSEVVELLDDANMEAVVRDFGDRNPQEDPVIHFYELFLKEFDAKKRMQRGVFYTPRPVVSYIVRSVDELLRTEFGLKDGLADTTTWGEMTKRDKHLKIPESVSSEQDFVQVLDPATGTGTFLVEAIDLIYKTLVAKWKAQGHDKQMIEVLWNDYVPKHLLTRLHGYELMMAPYAIAHLKIGLKLYETGYNFGSDERARIYLTNTLEPAHDFAGTFAFAIPALAHESLAVNLVKRDQHFTVVIGNPPYSIQSQNLTEKARSWVDPYRYVDGDLIREKGALQFEKSLQDDCVKFTSFAQSQIVKASAGILGVIMSHSFVDNPTLRGMRQNLWQTLNRIFVLDLHGNSTKKERCPDGSEDKNVFDIMQGVGILIATRKGDMSGGTASVSYSEIWGAREAKSGFLVNNSIGTTDSQAVTPTPSFHIFRPQCAGARDEFDRGFKITDIFIKGNVGIITARDNMVIDFDSEPLIQRARVFRDSRLPDQGLCEHLKISLKKGWDISRAREAIRKDKNLEHYVKPLCYRPFDYRLIIYHPSLVWGMSYPTMQHMLSGTNLGLMVGRAGQVIGQGIWDILFCTRGLTEFNLYRRGGHNLFPLYLVTETARSQATLSGYSPSVPNLSTSFLNAISKSLDIRRGGQYGLPQGLTPEYIFHYIYAVFHSPDYRTRYAEFLKIDFPRLPLTSSLELFRQLARLGGEIVALHLVEAPTQKALSARYDKAAKAWRYEIAKGQRLPVTLSFNGPEKPIVDKVGWSNNTVWIDAVKPKKNGAEAKATGTVGFRGVPEDVWNFHIGGYQVCEKWLKDRKDRILTADDIAHYHRIVIALHETIRIMREIDEVIDQHGGWPGAFVQDASAVASQEPVVGEKSILERMVPSLEKASGSKVYRRDSMPLLKAAESDPPKYGSSNKENVEGQQNLSEVEVNRSEVMCLIRQIFTDGGGVRNRDTVINALAKEMGYARVDDGIRGELENSLRTAVRRGILENRSGDLALLVRTITDYDRDFMKDQFLASLSGRTWADRDEAIRAFSRWMGFRRVGPAIDEMARSLINGLLREGMLEKEGLKIRRRG